MTLNLARLATPARALDGRDEHNQACFIVKDDPKRAGDGVCLLRG